MTEADRLTRKQAYARYLKSAAWHRLRAAVLERANGRCEGCPDAPASQVHHLTYEHVGHEFLFELRALCNDCHARIHELDEKAKRAALSKVEQSETLTALSARLQRALGVDHG